MSGTLGGAGGVGGLLAVTRHERGGQAAESYWATWDLNGNVVGLISSTTSHAAVYEYDAFGRTLRVNEPEAGLNPIRFSSKYTDGESGMVYYGFRYYSPELGRWSSRDPIAESGGINPYGMVGNDSVNWFDPDGRAPMSGGFPAPFPPFIPSGGFQQPHIPEGPFAPIDGLNPALGGIDSPEVNQSNWFDYYYPEDVERAKSNMRLRVETAIYLRCKERKGPYEVEGFSWTPAGQNLFELNYEFGSGYMSMENLKVTWEEPNAEGEVPFKYTADMVLSDGLGFQNGPETMWNERNLLYPTLGSGGIGMYPDRSVKRGRWKIDGNGKCHCEP